MHPIHQQFRLSTLFHVMTALACIAALYRGIGLDGIFFLLCLASIPLFVIALVVGYVRVMSWVFDVVMGPFFLR